MPTHASTTCATPLRCDVFSRWYEAGASIEHGMFWLCTYLVHAKISDTYWYLTGAPELMELVGSKFEHFTRAGERNE